MISHINESRIIFREHLDDTECPKDVAHIPRQKVQIMLQTSLPPTFRNEVEERKGRRAQRAVGIATSGIAGAVQYEEGGGGGGREMKRGEKEKGKDRERERGDERRTKEDKARAGSRNEWREKFPSCSRGITNVAFVFRFRRRFAEQLGRRSLAPTVKYVQIRGRDGICESHTCTLVPS